VRDTKGVGSRKDILSFRLPTPLLSYYYRMARRLQFSLRTALVLVFVIALVAWPTTSWLRSYLANRGLVPVKGRVTYRGQPLQDAKVLMVPMKAGGRPIEVVTNGVGEMESLAMPGDYTVGITENGPAKRGLGVFVSVSDRWNEHL
jgi:hypothetical protein